MTALFESLFKGIKDELLFSFKSLDLELGNMQRPENVIVIVDRKDSWQERYLKLLLIGIEL
ncbi:hypothetical protein [Thermosyntropha sp.]|uniref:hypothetical protein n=1 Tax=Thermosyntropha sp. TaxID=2740820 RepID=UPI0025FA5E46|nr:hypothetical protein [Thermosyntropha sp.]MBO8158223.1 hypothetical protein [Thermosyntropha sp.]